MLLTEKMDHWKYIRNKYNYDILEWWENIVKPGLKKLAIEKQKDINKSRRGMLNLLYIRQIHITNCINKGKLEKISELSEIQSRIENWFSTEADRIKTQIKIDDIITNEKVNLHHYEIHKKVAKRSHILNLETSEGAKKDMKSVRNF